MKLWRQFIFPLCRGHGPVSRGHVCVQFTGEPPANPSEDLIRQLVGGRSSVSLGWLKEQIADALYHEGLRQGAWAVDIGILGSGRFPEGGHAHSGGYPSRVWPSHRGGRSRVKEKQ